MTPLYKWSLLLYCAASFPAILQGNLCHVQMLCLGHFVTAASITQRCCSSWMLVKLIPPQLQNQPMAGRINRRANRIMPWPRSTSQIPNFASLCGQCGQMTLMCQEHSYVSQDCPFLLIVHGKPEGSSNIILIHAFCCHWLFIQRAGDYTATLSEGERKLVIFTGICWFIGSLLEAPRWHFLQGSHPNHFSGEQLRSLPQTQPGLPTPHRNLASLSRRWEGVIPERRAPMAQRHTVLNHCG